MSEYCTDKEYWDEEVKTPDYYDHLYEIYKDSKMGLELRVLRYWSNGWYYKLK
ncbi:MAG: hypothetical protein PHX47_04570 [Candidatus ainarchaeum sp.]|nr:hypothetical protein [Candidatus ainarchaeum sp.]